MSVHRENNTANLPSILQGRLYPPNRFYRRRFAAKADAAILPRRLCNGGNCLLHPLRPNNRRNYRDVFLGYS